MFWNNCKLYFFVKVANKHENKFNKYFNVHENFFKIILFLLITTVRKSLTEGKKIFFVRA